MADYNFLNEQGLIIPDTSTTRDGVIADFRAAFGNDIDIDPSSPSGLLIALHTELRDFVIRNNSDLANQINPDYATGVFLDAIFGLTDAYGRRPATRSILNGVVLSGEAGTVVPAGTLAADINGKQWALVDSVTIPQAGSISASFEAVEYGAITCEVGQLQTFVTSILGLISVHNPIAASLGRDAERDVHVRRRRRETLAIQSMSTPEAIRSRIMALDGVRSLQFLENTESTLQVIKSITMKPHSIWVCIDGGEDEEIARALFDVKTSGAGYNGAVQVDISDPRSQVLYPVNFDRPVEKAILIRVTVRQSVFDAQNLIPDLVMNYVNGDIEGNQSFVVGVDVSPWEIAGAINQQEPRLSVVKVELSEVGSGVWSTDVFSVGINELAKTQHSSVSVVVA
jgi:uncharacterized phage protein gp47/JayE